MPTYAELMDRPSRPWSSRGEFISAVPGLNRHPIDSPEGKKALKEYEESKEAKEYIRKYVKGC